MTAKSATRRQRHASPSTQAVLSEKNIPANERLILALDVPTVAEAKDLVLRLNDSVNFYKIGMGLLATGDYFTLLAWLRQHEKKVFVDLKFFDVPETVKNAVRQLRPWGASFATVHGNDEMMRAAVSEKGDTKILAVTVLTSLDRGDLDDLGFKVDVTKLVLSRARRAIEIGCDGVISSGLEAPMLRKKLGTQFLVITPGIRPVENKEAPRPKDDQKRTTDVEEAFRNGADYIVIGRPILKAPDPIAAAEAVQERIAKLFAPTR